MNLKDLYKFPAITVEELNEKDVICESSGGTVDPNHHDTTNTGMENLAGEFNL